MVRRLRNLSLNEVSIVPKGANPGAKILFAKTDEEGMEYCDDCPNKAKCGEVGKCAKTPDKPDGDVSKRFGSIRNWIEKTFGAIGLQRFEKDHPTVSLDAAIGAMEESLKSIREATTGDKRALALKSLEQFAALIEGGPDGNVTQPENEMDKTAVEALVKESVTKALDEVNKANQTAIETIRKEAKTQVEVAEVRMKKAEDALTALTEANRVLAETQRVEATKARLDKIAKQGIDVSKMLPVAASISEEVLAGLEAAAIAVEKRAKIAGLFAEHGSSGEGASGEAMTQITAKAEAIRKAAPTLTKEQAWDKALLDNPELYAQYKAERASGAH